MLVSPLTALFTLLLPNVEAFRRIGPFGMATGDGEWDPSSQMAIESTPVSILCKGGDSLDFLEVDYAFAKDPYKRLSFGNAEFGTQQGPVQLAKHELKSVTPYICSDGWYIGTVCGLKLDFESRDSILCGIDESSGHASVPQSLGPDKKFVFGDNKLFSFFVNTSANATVITKIGWTLAGERDL